METTIIPVGLCQCGCGQPTRLASQTDRRLGWVKGQPLKYALGHNSKSGQPSTQAFCACGCGAPLPVAKYRSHQSRVLRGHVRPQHDQAAILERFWSRVDKNGPVPTHRPELGPCWVFTGSDRGPLGHARMHVRNKRTSAHRFAWELEHGPIADGLQVLHHCDNGACVRGAHLFLGTQADNMRDMSEKGRQRKPRALQGAA